MLVCLCKNLFGMAATIMQSVVNHQKLSTIERCFATKKNHEGERKDSVSFRGTSSKSHEESTKNLSQNPGLDSPT